MNKISKIFILSFFFMFTLFLIPSNVYADTTDDGRLVSLPDLPTDSNLPYYHIVYYGSEYNSKPYFILYLLHDKYVVNDTSSNGHFTKFCYHGDCVFTSYLYTVGSSTDWESLGSNTSGQVYIDYYIRSDSTGDFVGKPLYNNYVIYNDSGDLLFQKASRTILTTSTLRSVMSQIFFLIPCLTLCLVGLIAFYKAWSWLKMQLLAWGNR